MGKETALSRQAKLISDETLPYAKAGSAAGGVELQCCGLGMVVIVLSVEGCVRCDREDEGIVNDGSAKLINRGD